MRRSGMIHKIATATKQATPRPTPDVPVRVDDQGAEDPQDVEGGGDLALEVSADGLAQR